jgi:8-oxo-dGTP pyrophosphatase MutT (NUDIX family)
MKEDATFFVGQKAFIKKGNEVLVLRDPIEGIDYPGGKIQEGETDLIESLKREVREETGLEIFVGEPFATWMNAFPKGHRLAGKTVFLIGYKCEYVSGDINLSHEHDKFYWVTKKNFKDVDDGTQYFDILEKYFLN